MGWPNTDKREGYCRVIGTQWVSLGRICVCMLCVKKYLDVDTLEFIFQGVLYISSSRTL